MNLSEEIRRVGYKFFDIYKKNKVNKIQNDLESPHVKESYNNKGKLNKIVDHAIKTTDFYSKYKDYKFEELPVIRKENIKNQFDDFISNQYEKNKLNKVKTSGSYGTPMKFFHDKEKTLRRKIEVIYFNSWANYEVGMKHVLNAVGAKKSKLKLLIQNEIITNPTNISENWLQKQRKIFKNNNIHFYVGYSSIVKEFAEFCSKMGDTSQEFELKGIIATSEPLLEEARNKAEKVFGCPVLSRYSSLELGVLAQECKENKKHHINSSSYYIELLSLDSNEAVQEGEVGRIVVTDLYSYAMPLIRYDIGDLAVKTNEKCKCGRTSPIFQSLEGRLVENLLDENGNKISWVAINDAFWPYEKVIRFQIIQSDHRTYRLKLVTKEDFKRENQVIKDLKEILGAEIKIKINYVDKISPLESGKRPYIINELIKND